MAGSQKDWYEKLVDEVARLNAEVDALKTERSSLSSAIIVSPEVETQVRKMDEWVLSQEVVRRNLEVLVSIKKSGNFSNEIAKEIEDKVRSGIRALKFSFE